MLEHWIESWWMERTWRRRGWFSCWLRSAGVLMVGVGPAVCCEGAHAFDRAGLGGRGFEYHLGRRGVTRARSLRLCGLVMRLGLIEFDYEGKQGH
jgi:hypothetical protein